jgi:hypothetical protein
VVYLLPYLFLYKDFKMADIEHSALPDELLHEPKGASTAAEGTVYVADGNGSGAFRKIEPSDLSFTRPSYTSPELDDIDDTVTVVGDDLTQVADGTLTDVEDYTEVPAAVTNKINENAAELYRIFTNQKKINEEITASLLVLQSKISELANDLKAVGVIK